MKLRRHDPRRLATSDAELLVRVANGDREALGTLFERHGNEVHRFACRVAHPQDADEIVQLVFLQVGSSAARFDTPERSARSWIFGIASKIMAGRRRTYQRMRDVLVALAHVRGRDVATGNQGLRPDIERALALLAAPTREAFLLFEAHGFSGNEVAEMQSVPVGTVWRRLHDARIALRKCLGDEP